jgi:tetratricopeptide (TPR) repeat protein
MAAAGINAVPGTIGWENRNIGDATAQGGAIYNRQTKTWTVRGDGHDIHDSADGFHYVFQLLDGDGAIIARVDELSGSHPWAKAGVMIRETLDAGSTRANVTCSSQNGVRFHTRQATGAPGGTDTPVITPEQTAVRAPAWVKLERRGDQFFASYATKKEGKTPVWMPMVTSPQTISMARTVYIGLAVTSHTIGTLCEARFSDVTVRHGEIPDTDIAVDPNETLLKAYRRLQLYGPWREDALLMEECGDIIANSLFTIARARESKGETVDAILAEYRRIVTLLPETPSVADALARIVILDRDKGLAYARERLAGRSKEDLDRFYVALMRGCMNTPVSGDREDLVKLFIEHIVKTANLTLLERITDGLKCTEQELSLCRQLVQQSMVQASTEQVAVCCLRYVALKSAKGQQTDRIADLAKWTSTQFQGTRLATCAAAVLADVHYSRDRRVEAVQVFQPGLFAGNRAESETVAEIESGLASYLANTTLRGAVDLGQIYESLGQKAESLGLHVVTLHCYRGLAETKALSMTDFERSAAPGTKISGSGPENEVWFWKGLVLADGGDFDAAMATYERFLKNDGKSVLAARAYYDMARAKMALGEDARGWIEKAKPLSSCEAVARLDAQLNAKNSL